MCYKVRARERQVNVTAVIGGVVTEGLCKLRKIARLTEEGALDFGYVLRWMVNL
jgi:hypothetical protein